jgi:hypothetical protein
MLLANASMLMIITGNQQKKSVKIINSIRLAKAESWLTRVDLTALAALVAVRYITKYAITININEIPLRPRKTNAEYSQPADFSL